MNSTIKSQAKDIFDGCITVPNFLSLLRVFMVPAFAVLFLKGEYIWSVGILALSGLTDFLDGKIARKFNQISNLGKLLDPLADKLTQITIAIVFFITFWKAEDKYVHWFSLIFLVFLVKEVVMVVGSVIMILLNIRPEAAEMPGKIATFAFYVIMISMIAFGPEIGITGHYYPTPVMIVLVSVSAFLTIFAFCSYIPGVKKQYKEMKAAKAESDK